MPRDYGLVLSSSYTPSLAAPSEEEEGEPDGLPEESSNSAIDVDEESNLADESASTHDNMSHLSIGDETESTARALSPNHRRRRAPSAVSSQGSMRHHSAASYSSRNRHTSSDESHRLEAQQHEHSHSHIAGGLLSTSFLLGGEPMAPPPTADFRDEEEAIKDGDGEQWEDNDPTPMPGRFGHQDQWLSRPPLTRQQLEQQQREVEAAATASSAGKGSTERSSLLGGRPGPSPAGAPSDRQSSYGTYSHTFIPPGGTAHPASSAWSNIGNFSAPQFPAPEVIQEIDEEPSDNVPRRELIILTQYSLPVWGTHLLELSLNVVSVFSIGHLGTIQLAAASLSSMTANVTAFSLLSGFISALDSLLPPAFTSQPKRVGIYTQSMALIVAALLFPIALVWLNAEKLLLALGQDEEVARLSGLYLRYMLPGVPAFAGFEVCRRYLQAQGLMSASTMVLLVVSPLNAFLNWLLVWGPDSVRMGFVGAPLASAISNWLMFLLCIGQCWLAPRAAWPGISFKSAIRSANFMPCLTLGSFGFLAISSEWWAWEISSLITSLLGTTPLAAQSVLLVCSSIFYQQPFAISVAAAVRIGNLLGALKPHEAKISSNSSMILAVASGILNSGAILVFRKYIAGLFSDDPDVIDLLTVTLPLLALFQLADGLAGVSGGILRGTGRQHFSAALNSFAYYIIALPLGYWLTFSRGMGLPGEFLLRFMQGVRFETKLTSTYLLFI